MKSKIIIISGPTASGKTHTSIKLAEQFGGEIVNFDSLLFYKEISIGTAKPTLRERKEIPHHLIDSHSIFSPINAADFFKLAVPLINQLHQDNKLVFLVGGSGFYLQTILKGMFPSHTSSKEILQRSTKLYQSEGIGPFIEVLKQEDPDSFQRYHVNDHYRIRRAVEHFWETGELFSSARMHMQKKLVAAPPVEFGWNIRHIYLDIPKEYQWELIQKRTQKMLSEGLIEEVKNLLTIGATGREKPLQSIGYNEVLKLLKDEISSIDECAEKINIATRQLAKAQRTWFKKVDKFNYDPSSEWDKIENNIGTFLNE